MNSQSVGVRVMTTVVAIIIALWVANVLGIGLCVQIAVAVGKGLVGMVAGIFGVGQ